MVLNVASMTFSGGKKSTKETEGGKSKSDRKKSKGQMGQKTIQQNVLSEDYSGYRGQVLGLSWEKSKESILSQKIGHLWGTITVRPYWEIFRSRLQLRQSNTLHLHTLSQEKMSSEKSEQTF